MVVIGVVVGVVVIGVVVRVVVIGVVVGVVVNGVVVGVVVIGVVIGVVVNGVVVGLVVCRVACAFSVMSNLDTQPGPSVVFTPCDQFLHTRFTLYKLDVVQYFSKIESLSLHFFQ